MHVRHDFSSPLVSPTGGGNYLNCMKHSGKDIKSGLNTNM